MHDVVITGVGLVSCRGEGRDVHLDAVKACASSPDVSASAVIDTLRFAPYPVHPLAPVNFDTFIPKKSDQRQMEPWQRIGCQAAGLALEHAGLRGDSARLDILPLIVAAGGGERDYGVDGDILTQMRASPTPEDTLNERLMSDIRPTLFLAQLSNLLAGNISIVHGVTGASRTFMGEEQAGVDALRIAHARIMSGQDERILVGGSYNAERPDVLMIYEMAGLLYKHSAYTPVFDRAAPDDGFILGSAGAFLVLESRESAIARGVPALAVLDPVRVARTPAFQRADHLSHTLETLITIPETPVPDLIISGATGIHTLSHIENEVLKGHAPDAALIALGDIIGHTLETHMPFGVALAALAVAAGQAETTLVTSVGHQRGEGIAQVRAA